MERYCLPTKRFRPGILVLHSINEVNAMNQRKPSGAISTVVLFTLFAVSLFIGESVSAQSTTKNSVEGTTTTTEPDKTYGEGGTKETTKDANGNVGRTLKRDPQRRPREEVTYPFAPNDSVFSEKRWKYDSQGRLISVEQDSTDFVHRRGPLPLYRRKIEYKDDNDKEGKATDEQRDPEPGEWKPVSTAVSNSLGAIAKEGVAKPESIIGDLGVVKPTASPTPAPKEEAPDKTVPQKNPTSSQDSTTTQLVGLVYDKDIRAGDQVMMSLTADPQKYKNIPGLGVIEVKVPANAGVTAQDALKGMVFDTDSGQQQPAGRPMVMQLAKSAGSISMKIIAQHSSDADTYDYVLETGGAGNIIGGEWVGASKIPHPDFLWLPTQANIPFNQGPPSTAVNNTGAPADFTTPPVIQDTSFIHGPFSGKGNVTQIMVDDQPAKIIAGSSTTLFFASPEA